MFVFVLQLNIGYFMTGPLILGPALSCLNVLSVNMVWIAAFGTLATAWMMNSFWLICLISIFFCLTGFLQVVYESVYI